jgi:transposase
LGRPLAFFLSPGQASDLEGADVLLPQLEAPILIGDKGYDADGRVRDKLAAEQKTAVIPPKSNRKAPASYDKELYKKRHRIENLFGKLKDYRALATRYDKLARNFLSGVYLAAAILWTDS